MHNDCRPTRSSEHLHLFSIPSSLFRNYWASVITLVKLCDISILYLIKPWFVFLRALIVTAVDYRSDVRLMLSIFDCHRVYYVIPKQWWMRFEIKIFQIVICNLVLIWNYFDFKNLLLLLICCNYLKNLYYKCFF